MKKLLFGALALTFLATACKKDDEGPSNSWTVGSTTYGAANVTGAFGSLVATTGSGSTINSIQVNFNGVTLPTTGGTYDVVAGGTPAANQISFSASEVSNGVSKVFTSTGSGNVKANVSVNGGKVSVSMPSAEAQLSGASETTRVSINITQN